MSDAGADMRTVTLLLQRVGAGDHRAWEPLLLEVHGLLRAMAHRSMEGERSGHVLQTTALVNEAWMRLARAGEQGYATRSDFFRAAASAMRRILVDEARRRLAHKRGGGAQGLRISQLVEALPDAAPVDGDPDLEALDRALRTFEREVRHAKKCRVVELRYFVGLTLEQTAEALGVSLATVKRDWEFARAWLQREMSRAAGA